MLFTLNAAHKQEIFNAEQDYTDALRKYASESSDQSTLNEVTIDEFIKDADHRDELIKDESNWFIEHSPGIYEYSNIFNKPYSWEIDEYTFHDELRVVFNQYKDTFTDDEQATYTKKLHACYDSPADYGVCDNAQQILDKWSMLLTDERNFIIKMDKVTRIDNPGWRWHKNGQYIGTQDASGEHLGDCEDIDHVYMFRILQAN